jgi:hypothetical protein
MGRPACWPGWLEAADNAVATRRARGMVAMQGGLYILVWRAAQLSVQAGLD